MRLGERRCGQITHTSRNSADVLLKAMRARSTGVFISPKMAIAEIYNTFPGELGFVSEEQASAAMYSMRSREYDFTGAASTSPLHQCLHLQSILNDQGLTLLAYLLRNISVKAGKETYISRIVGGEVFSLCTRWQCKMFIVLDSSKRHS